MYPGSSLLQIHYTELDYITSLYKNLAFQRGCWVRSLSCSGNQMCVLTWKLCQAGKEPASHSDIFSPGLNGRMVWFLSWAPDVFLPLLPEVGPTRHVGSCFYRGFDSWAGSAEHGVREGSLACSLCPTSPLPLLISEGTRGRPKARQKTCGISRSVDQMSVCLAFKLETQDWFPWASLRK